MKNLEQEFREHDIHLLKTKFLNQASDFVEAVREHKLLNETQPFYNESLATFGELEILINKNETNSATIV